MPKLEDTHLYILPPLLTNFTGSKNLQKIIEANDNETFHEMSRDFYNLSSNTKNVAVDKCYLKSASHGLAFSHDVVEERSAHMLPYDQSKLKKLLKADDIVDTTHPVIHEGGRVNTRLGTKHVVCHLKPNTYIPPLEKPLKVPQVTKPVIYKEPVKFKPGAPLPHSLPTSARPSVTKIASLRPSLKVVFDEKTIEKSPHDSHISTFITESIHADESASKIRRPTSAMAREKYAHEAQLLSLVGHRMSNWIVQRLLTGEQKEALACLVKEWHGRRDVSDMLLKEGKPEEVDDGPYKMVVKEKPMWCKPQASLLEKVYGTASDTSHATDPYSDENSAPFYRQPTAVRKQKKEERKEHAGAINATAHEIYVQTFEPPPPPELRDFMNPKLDKTCYVTECAFQNERLTGVDQIHQSDNTKIVMTTNNRYRKQTRSEFPPGVDQWYEEKGDMGPTGEDPVIVEKGLSRWCKFPEAIDDTKSLHRYPEKEEVKIEPRLKRINNPSLVKIVDDWRSSMYLKTQFLDSTWEDLIHDMADIQSHVRLKAIATVAKASTYKDNEFDEFTSFASQEKPIVSDKIFVALAHLLGDECFKVRTLAAIALCSLGRPSPEAKAILRTSFHEGNATDKWACVQCLAQQGESDPEIIGEIIRALMMSEDSVLHEQACSLLVKLSQTSNLVHPLVAEQLNNKGWRQKIIACKVLPTLDGAINKDVTNKLVNLMWKDWHAEVRTCAAQALGKSGNGRVVHDDLIKKIGHSNESVRVESISKIGHLGIMTAKLLPAFLECFSDPYFSVRIEACITCGNLRIRDSRVLQELIKLASHDTMWKVKAIAMQALSKIGLVQPEIKAVLLWALRYEALPGVRVEAGRSLSALNLVDEEVAAILKDQLLVEGNKNVRKEITRALLDVGVTPSADMNLVGTIKKEVHKLGQPDLISEQIRVNENEARRIQDGRNRVYHSASQIKTVERTIPKKHVCDATPKKPKTPRKKVPIQPNTLDDHVFTSGLSALMEEASHDVMAANAPPKDPSFTTAVKTVGPAIVHDVLRYNHIYEGHIKLTEPSKENVREVTDKVELELRGDAKLTDRVQVDSEPGTPSSGHSGSCEIDTDSSSSQGESTMKRKMRKSEYMTSEGGMSDLSDDVASSDGYPADMSVIKKEEKHWFDDNKDVMMDDTKNKTPLPSTPGGVDSPRTVATPVARKSVILSVEDLAEKEKIDEVSDDIFVNLERRYSKKVILLASELGFLKVMPSEIPEVSVDVESSEALLNSSEREDQEIMERVDGIVGSIPKLECVVKTKCSLNSSDDGVMHAEEFGYKWEKEFDPPSSEHMDIDDVVKLKYGVQGRESQDTIQKSDAEEGHNDGEVKSDVEEGQTEDSARKCDAGEGQSDIGELNSEIGEGQSEVSGLKSDKQEGHTEGSALKCEVGEGENDVGELKSDIQEGHTDSAFKLDIEGQNDVNELKSDVVQGEHTDVNGHSSLNSAFTVSPGESFDGNVSGEHKGPE